MTKDGVYLGARRRCLSGCQRAAEKDADAALRGLQSQGPARSGMTATVYLPDCLAAVLEAEAACHSQSPDRVAAELLAERLPVAVSPDPQDAFTGTADSVNAQAGRESRQLRAWAAARRAD
jgi:hypothetical protein